MSTSEHSRPHIVVCTEQKKCWHYALRCQTPSNRTRYRRMADIATIDGEHCSQNESDWDDDESSTDSCLELIQLKSVRNHGLETGVTFSFKEGPMLHISTLLEEDRIAPLFSGAEWAGTRVWHACVRAVEYLDNNFTAELNNGASLLELGCGLGVPGMIARLLGGHVILTDQDSLLKQLRCNIESNFKGDDRITAEALDWSREEVQKLLNNTGNNQGFDIVLNCDCVFEPLYGESWKLLVEVIDELLRVNPKSTIISSVERRNGDGIDKFLQAMRDSLHVTQVEEVYHDENNDINIFITRGGLTEKILDSAT